MPLPLGLLSAAGVLAGLGGRRTAALGLLATAGDRRRRLRRAARLPRARYRTARPATYRHRRRPGRRDTLVFVAHHDAANGGLIFRPELTRLVADTFPGWYERQTRRRR